MLPDRTPDTVVPCLMTDAEAIELLDSHGTDLTLWEVFTRWLIRHRLQRPDDTREDAELVDEFADSIAPMVSHAELCL